MSRPTTCTRAATSTRWLQEFPWTMPTGGRGWIGQPRLASAQPPAVLGCSALNRAYRDQLRNGAGEPLKFLHLTGPVSLIATRLAARKGHFMPPGLLECQFDTLEPPDEDESAITASIDREPDEIVAHLLIATKEETS